MNRLLASLAALLALATLAGPAPAAELLMFEQPGCMWCQRWHERIGPAYPKTEEGQRAPLRVLQRHGRLPTPYKLKAPVIMTPTFVLVDNRCREVDRITGYAPEEFFWSLLAEMLARLPAGADAARVRQISHRR